MDALVRDNNQALDQLDKVLGVHAALVRAVWQQSAIRFRDMRMVLWAIHNGVFSM